MSDASTTTTTDTAAAPAQGATDQAAAAASTQQDSTQTGQDTTQTGKAGEQPAAQADGDQKQGKEGGEAGGKPTGAPETYADFELPEGISLDAEDSDAIKAYAKEHNLSQEAAQKLVSDLGVKQAQKFESKMREAMEARNAEWTDASKADKEFGGDKLAENLAVAKTFLDAHGTPELKKFLVETGLGNHPEMIRLMYRAGKAISEDTAVQGGQPATAGKVDAATALYGKSTPK
ncbi:hypothetical protein CAL26_09960 [Bordetella genomosp. 9]|uniref:Peptidase n=1 Tax=Bordetella genomosp. 9 TaxID=1416803 RepID=A0A261RFL3_9BORD|nr:hypothetical protein [Bordetella genomosp. 9]OZI23745.1 hypothetical protein CAL26_09960 [Bordetella genomosp. 9]